MLTYNAELADEFHSLSTQQRDYFRVMLAEGFTDDSAIELFQDGVADEASSGTQFVEGIAAVWTQSAKNDYEGIRNANLRKRIDAILTDISETTVHSRCQKIPGGPGLLLAAREFRVVFKKGNAGVPVIYGIALDGINPMQKVWRYFDQCKAEDFLKKGCLYFCRLDKLIGDPREGRLPLSHKREKMEAFRGVFREKTATVVDNQEEFIRATTYVCCWTQREQESYLAWKHYCPKSGGFAIQTTSRRIRHLHSALSEKDANIHCRPIEYIDPDSEKLPPSDYGAEVFWKSNWFSDENEIRFAVMRHPSGTHEEIRHAITKMPHGERISCDLQSLVHSIVFNPFASSATRQSLQERLEKFQPNLADRVRKSVIIPASK